MDVFDLVFEVNYAAKIMVAILLNYPTEVNWDFFKVKVQALFDLGNFHFCFFLIFHPLILSEFWVIKKLDDIAHLKPNENEKNNYPTDYCFFNNTVT
ncbi:MAG: hypothetical protein AAF573_03770 [Bacteroidota bacterium]